VTFLDVGQGDAVLLEVAEGAVLVDQGPPEARVARQLRELGVRRLAALVLTHPQRDHIGGAAEVLTRVAVERVLDPRLATPSPFRTAALRAAAAHDVPVVQTRAGAAWRIGRLRLRVLWPSRAGSATDDPNTLPIVLLATYGTVDLLLTADAETEVTAPLVGRHVEVLKVAHHGSADDRLPAELRQLRPVVAVVSVGRRNRYGHPHPATLTALRAVRGLRLYRTDVDGRITLETDGRTLGVRTGAGGTVD
jgi:competence protein ComEC